MVVLSAGAQVGAGQPFVGESGPVGAAPDRNGLGLHAHKLHGFSSPVHNIHTGLDLLPHIVIAILQGQLQSAGTVLPVDVVPGGGHEILLFPELLAVVVPDDVAQNSLLYLALHIRQVDEALVALCVFRLLLDRQQAVKLHGDALRIHHLVLGGARMYIQPMDRHHGRGRVKVLVFQFSQCAAVGGIGIVRAEALHVEVIRPGADLLVRCKADLHRGMLASFCQEPLCRGQDFRHTGLVVGSQEGRAIGDDQVLAYVSGQGLIFLRLQKDALLLVQEDIPSIVLDDSGLDILAGGIRSRIHVGDQADGGQTLVPGNGAVHIAHFVHVGIGNAHGLHFLRQSSPQHLLPRGRGGGAGEFIGGGLIAYIAQEALYNRFHILFLSCKPSPGRG